VNPVNHWKIARTVKMVLHIGKKLGLPDPLKTKNWPTLVLTHETRYKPNIGLFLFLITTQHWFKQNHEDDGIIYRDQVI
jgi:hypothetical protein